MLLLLLIRMKKKDEEDDRRDFEGLTRLEMAQATAQAMAYDKERRKTRKGRRYGNYTFR